MKTDPALEGQGSRPLILSWLSPDLKKEIDISQEEIWGVKETEVKLF